jgi:O-methyltransferase
MSEWITRVAKQIHTSLIKDDAATKTTRDHLPPDLEARYVDVWRRIQSYTLTTPERVAALCSSVEYIVRNNIPGDIVECGVWKGGSMMAVAHMLNSLNTHRRLVLFDTFAGMTAPGAVDKDFTGTLAAHHMARENYETGATWAYSPLEEVRQNLKSTGYNEKLMTFVEGKVEETIPQNAPETIALLRLDTDWFESTYHELVHLYPRLSVGGVLIIDDYGHWQGAREATDRYIAEHRLKLLLSRIDYTGRICVKVEP